MSKRKADSIRTYHQLQHQAWKEFLWIKSGGFWRFFGFVCFLVPCFESEKLIAFFDCLISLISV
jgi:hypothetical protein